MASLFITDQTEASVTFTDTDLYDIIILPEADGITTSGRIISVFGGHSTGMDVELESYGLSLGKSDACVSIGGNYRDNEKKTFEYKISWKNVDWTSDFTGASVVSMDANYNINHLQYNDDYESGAIHYRGSNGYLVLTAQSGAGNADAYHNSKRGYKYKTDDDIALRSESYGMYSVFDNDGNTNIYGVPGMPSKPFSTTVAYTIHADKKLTVVSDLAGHIETDVAAIHTGYQIKSGDKYAYAEDSSNNVVVAAGVKANDLILEQNFRANVVSLNNEETFNRGLFGATMNDGWGKQVIGSVAIVQPEGGDPDITKDPNNIDGTTIAGVHAPTASNNDVSTYGIWTTGSLDASDSVWAGTIKATTDDVSILAREDLLRQIDKDDKPVKYTATATGNTIAAYGIKSGGTVNIKEMSGLRSDDHDNGNGEGITVNAAITVNANNNRISAKAVGDKDHTASASISDSKIIAAGIYADKIIIGEVTDKVKITVNAKDNKFEAIASGGTATISDSGLYTYGLYASSDIEFGSFDGAIAIDTINSDQSTAVGINVGGTLKANYLNGKITIAGENDSTGVKADKISVAGAIYTTIETNTVGIDTKNSIDADAFAGTIESQVGINVRNDFSGKTEHDSFDISGEITATHGVLALNSVNIRVSGTIIASSAISSELYYSSDSWLVNSVKFNDNVELSDSAFVLGNIDLGAGINTLTVNSNATFYGGISTKGGGLNLVFMLDGAAKYGSCLTITSLDNDSTLRDTRTITINMNYAKEDETYTLVRYNSMEDLTEYWENRLIAFYYQGYAATLTLKADSSNDLSGSTEIYDASGNLIGKINATFIKNQFSVNVEEANKEADALILTSRAEDANEDNYVSRTYDKESRILSLDWNDFKNWIPSAENPEAKLPNIAAYEIEYIIGDAKSILTRVDGETTKLDILGIAPNSTVKWRMRILGDDTAGTVSAWSDWETISENSENIGVTTQGTEKESSFSFENFTTSVTDANPQNGITGIVSAVAQCKWEDFESTYNIRNYIIEYCPSNDQITLQDAIAADCDSIEKYITDVYLERDDLTVYTKVVTGTQVDISDIQNQSYVYWRIKAVDVKGEESPWKAGETFRVWVNSDTVAPQFTNETTRCIVNFELDDPNNFDEQTKLTGYIGWNSAYDTESGVAAYRIELKGDDGVWKEFKYLGVEEKVTQTMIGYTDDTFDKDKTYTITYIDSNGNTIEVSTAVVKTTIDNNTGKEINTLWFIVEGKQSNTEFTIVSSAGDEFKVVPSQNDNNCQFEVYDYTLSLTAQDQELNGAAYEYRISAIDYFGKVSKYITGDFSIDSKAPAFVSKNVSVKLNEDRTDVTDVKLQPTITWNKAEDYISDFGVRYYELYVDFGDGKGLQSVAKIADDGRDTYQYSFDKKINAQVYQYKISAIDYFGRSAVISGSFGSKDMDAPTGQFTRGTMASKIDVSYSTQYEEVVDYDDQGNAVSTLIPIGEALDSATVTLSWDDSFSDEANQSLANKGVIYRVVVSNSSSFSSEAKTYEFWTKPEDGKQMVFSNATHGRTAGIFEGMDKVYWYVIAYDVNYNKVAEPSEVGSFQFVDDTGTPIVSDIAPTKPVIVSADDSKRDDNGVCTDEVSVTWTCDANLLGVYSFTVQLKDKNGNVVYERNSLDLSDKLNTDLTPEIAINGKQLTISNLKEFFGKTTIEDGEYQLVITSVDAAGRTRESDPYDINIDTIKPSKPVFDEENSGAFASNRGQEKYNTVVFSWKDVVDASGVDYYLVRYFNDNDKEKAMEVKVYDATSYTLTTSSVGSVYHFQVTAYDKKGNPGYEGDWYDIKTVEDGFADNIKDIAGVSSFTGNKFTTDKADGAQESVGIGDTGDAFKFRIENDMVVNLYVSNLSAFVGDNDDIKISLYVTENGETGRAGSWTVNGDSRVLSNIVFEKDHDYMILVESADSANSVVKYTVSLDSFNLNRNGGISKEDDSMTDENGNLKAAQEYDLTTGGNDQIFDNNWIGAADSVDGKIIQVTASGKYVFSLGDAASAIKVNIYELNGDKKKSIASISVSDKNVKDVTTKELVLDSSKKYYVEAIHDDKGAYGTDYNLGISCVEAFPAPTTADDVRDAYLAGATEGWVGFGDQVDYVSRFEVGENGGVYNFTAGHDITNGNQAIKLIVWQENGTDKKGNMTYKAVNTFTISNKEDLKSSGWLYLNKGTYFVEINAPGSAKAQNSSYEFNCERYEVTDEMLADTANNTLNAGIEDIPISSPTEGWVGIGDKTDIYKFTVDSNGAYEFNIKDFNGKELTATIYRWTYNDATGKYSKVKVTSKTGVNSASVMTLAANLEAGVDYCIEFTANGAKANSKYTVEYGKINANNADDKLLTAKQQATSAVTYTYGELKGELDGEMVKGELTNGWVGFSDTTDFVKLNLDETGSGLYNINIEDIENPVKLTLHQAVKNSNGDITSYAKLKTVTLTSGTTDGSLSDLLLDKNGEYYVEVTAANGAKGDNTNYKLSLESAAETIKAEALPAGSKTGDASKTALYTFLAPENGGAYKFSLNGEAVENNAVKLTVYELLTNGKTRSVKSITVKADAKGDTGYLYLDDDVVANGTGIYMIEVKPSNNKTTGNYELLIDGYQFGDYIVNANNDNDETITLGTSTAKNWVGMGDVSDSYSFNVANAGVYTLNFDEINGNNIKITVIDSTGKKKSFTPAANSTAAEISYEFAAGDYTILVSSADNGKSKFSEYSLNIESRLDDISKKDNSWNDADVATIAAGGTAGEGWVGLKDSKDYHRLDIAETGNYTVSLGNTTNDVKLTVFEIKNGKESSVCSVTVKAGTSADISGLMLESGKKYYVCVQAANTSGTKDATYSGLEVTNNWLATECKDSTFENPDTIVPGIAQKSAVWKNGDKEDYYKLVVDSDGSYTFDLEGISGNAIKISIGQDVNGTFKAIQSITGAKGADSAEFSRFLEKGEYYIKVESAVANSSSKYEITVTCNNDRNTSFSNADDIWTDVLADIDAPKYREDDLIENWVGLGDTNDVFRIRLDENGQISFNGSDADTINSLLNKEIALSLVDITGKEIALTFDKADGSYDTNVMLAAGVDYFLNVQSTKPANADSEFKLKLNITAL